MQGRIVKGVAGFYEVFTPDGTYVCRAKGIFRKESRKPLVGDLVLMDIVSEQDMEGSITELLPRRNELIRPQVANVDQTLLIFALVSPLPNYLLLDKLILQYKQQDIPVLLCFNKEDLVEEKDVAALDRMYEKSGCRVLFTSAKSGEGVEAVKDLLKGKTTVVAGPSGVGKSSLINCFQSDRQMETGEISKKVSRGKHTTRHSEIVAVDKDTFIMDTPGFTSYDVCNLSCEDLGSYYEEFGPYTGCYFKPCSHIHEPDCCVKEAVAKGEIPKERYEHYVQIYEEIKMRSKRTYN